MLSAERETHKEPVLFFAYTLINSIMSFKKVSALPLDIYVHLSTPIKNPNAMRSQKNPSRVQMAYKSYGGNACVAFCPGMQVCARGWIC